MRLARGSLGAIGLTLLLVGVIGLVGDLPPWDLLHLAAWLAGATILHDGFLVPLLLALGAALWWLTKSLPSAVRETIIGAFATAGMLTLLAWPLILRQDAGVNPTALPQRYDHNLGLLLLIITIGATLCAGAGWLYSYRVNRRAPDRLR